MWTKGNNKGEWEVITDEDHVVVDVHTEHHLNCDTSDFCCEDLLSVKFDNPHDERLFQLAPRMAEALLDLPGMIRALIGIYSDQYTHNYCNLIDELRQMKHGDK